MDKRITVEAPAKLNLFLQVGPRRPDGYHEVRTVMQALGLCDRLTLGWAEGEGSYRVEPEGMAASLPWSRENLAFRAWELYRREAGLAGRGLHLELSKRIPLAGGLGGGSSDASAVLVGLEELTGGALGREALLRLAGELGSDVPFFLTGGTALAEDRGERVTPLDPAPPLWAVLANPGAPLSTAAVYSHFDALSGAEAAGGLPREDLDGFLEALRSGDSRRVFGSLRNDLQAACLELLPPASALLEDFTRLLGRLPEEGGCSRVMVSGSGPTLFALVAEEGEARRLEGELAGIAPIAFAVPLA